MKKITDTNEFIEIASILSKSDVPEKDCIYITHFLIDLQHQLEEKDKVIDETIEQVNKIIIKPTPFFKNLEGSILAPKEEANKLLEILERGKNE